MHYQGGKYRFIKHITPIIQAEIDKHQARHFISPFCGACNIESAIVHTDKTCNDKNAYIIQMWRELQQGREFPSTVTEEQYKHVRDHKDEDPALTGFCGAGCSYAGIWFHCYARNKTGKNYADQAKRGNETTMSGRIYRNFAREAKDSNERMMNAGLKHAVFTAGDYKDVEIPPDTVMYCDPPYANTAEYDGAKGFNSAEFWAYMDELLDNTPNLSIFVSEQTAPSGWREVWQKECLQEINKNPKHTGRRRIERLFYKTNREEQDGHIKT